MAARRLGIKWIIACSDPHEHGNGTRYTSREAGHANPAHLIVRLKLVDLLPINLDPEVLANELDYLKFVDEARAILGIPLSEALSYLKSYSLHPPRGHLQL
eukprot:scaffold23194_cov30-Tisochrysis_lutea.AAC.6